MLTYTIIILKIFFIKIKTIKTNKNEIAVRNLDEPIINCEEFKDCFNCSACGPDVVVSNCLCYWSHNKCQNVSFNPILNWKDIFMQCEDDSSNQIKNTYCGNFTKTSKKNKMNLKLPKVNGYYGLTNLFCEYFYYNDQKSNTEFKITVTINSKYLYNSNNILLGIKIHYNDNTHESITMTTHSNSYSFFEIRNIQISYLSADSYIDNPFEIDIEYKTPSTTIGIYVIFIIILICIILCAFSIFYFSRRTAINSRLRDIRNEINNNEQSSNVENEENKKKIIEELLNDDSKLGERICESKYEKYGTNCTICLEELKVGIDKVSLTPCFHVFHYKCLSNWLRNNVSTLKCPNCNCDLTSMNNENINK